MTLRTSDLERLGRRGPEETDIGTTIAVENGMIRGSEARVDVGDSGD